MLKFRSGYAAGADFVMALRVGHRVPVWAGAAIDAWATGVVSYLRSVGEGVTLNRGDENPGTDSGRQATSCEPTSVSTLG